MDKMRIANLRDVTVGTEYRHGIIHLTEPGHSLLQGSQGFARPHAVVNAIYRS